MKRYLNSFFLTLVLYLGIAFALFMMFNDKNIIVKEKKEVKTISLKHIELKKEIKKEPEPQPTKVVEKKEVIEKKVPKKKIEPKKEIVKKIVKPKKIIKKKIVKKKPIKKKKIVKKVKPKKIEKIKEVEIAKVIEPIISQPIVEKVTTVIKKTSALPTKKLDVKKEYLKQNYALIRKYIKQNVKYPKRAKRLRIQDVVRVRFSLSKNGSISNITILSGNKHLHKATIKAVKKASTSFPKVSKDITIELPIEYKLI